MLLLAAIVASGSAASAASTSPVLRDTVARPAVAAQPSDALINFDNLVTGGPGGAGALVTVNTQYAAQGVTFNNVSAIDYSKGSFAIPTFAHSGTVAVEPCFAIEFCKSPVGATFTAAQRRVRVWVGFSSPLSQAYPVRLKAFDAASAVVGMTNVTLRASSAATPIRAPLDVDAGSARIVRLEVSSPGGFDNGLAVDDVEFSTAGPPPTCNATAVPSVRVESPTDGLVVETNAFLLKGTVNGNGAPIESASITAEGGTVKVGSLFPTLIGPTGGPFGPTSYGGLLAPGKQKIIVTATNCRGTGAAQARSVEWHEPDARVSTYAQLKDALAAGKKYIWVENSARIDLAAIFDHTTALEYVLHIPDGVTLASGRSPTEDGGLLYMSRRLVDRPHMLDLGSNTRVTGLRLRGYNPSDTTVRKDPSDAIFIQSNDVMVDNNEISGWPGAGVGIANALNSRTTAGRIHVTRNYIHNNVQCNLGYGVVVGGKGFALIDKNVFDFNRHDVAGDGAAGTGYIAELNFVLTSGPTCNGHYNQHFDMHGTGPDGYGGTGGEYIEIRHNTIRGEQRYGILGRLTRPAFDLRGTPTDRAIFNENAVAHDGEDEAVRLDSVDRGSLKAQRKLFVSDNRYDVDTELELGVGDFNGDGRADVFQAAGAVWAYSPSGRREWHFLNDSSLRLDRLGLADFDGDGKTDVFSQQGDTWRVSYGGTTEFKPLPAGSNIDISTYRFADFDGDKKADVFRANGSQWYISSGGATAWQPLAPSSFKVGDLRFGDFNGDGKTDVFSLANSQWSVSYGGATGWQRLNARLSSDLGKLGFADFNGDGRTDVARLNDGKLEVSLGGTTPWQKPGASSLPQLGLMLFGDFTGDRKADVLQRAEIVATPPSVRSLTRFKLSGGGASVLVPWSVADLR